MLRIFAGVQWRRSLPFGIAQSPAMNLLLADSHSLSRLGLRTLLADQSQVNDVLEAASTTELLECLSAQSVDLVMIDFTAEAFGVDCLAAMRQRFPRIPMLAITSEQTGFTIASAVRAGITGYVKKSCSLEEILEAVEETSKGTRFFCGQVLETLRRASMDVDQLMANEASCEPLSISARELEIIALIAEGNTNTQIAGKLYLSGHTVGTHRKNIMHKLGVNNTAAVVMYAVKTGLVNPNRFLFSARAL